MYYRAFYITSMTKYHQYAFCRRLLCIIWSDVCKEEVLNLNKNDLYIEKDYLAYIMMKECSKLIFTGNIEINKDKKMWVIWRIRFLSLFDRILSKKTKVTNSKKWQKIIDNYQVPRQKWTQYTEKEVPKYIFL